MSIKYIIVQNKYYCENLSIVSFGMAIAEEHNGSVTILKTFADLSPNFADVEKLVRLCNEQKLDLIHLDDVINDFI